MTDLNISKHLKPKLLALLPDPKEVKSSHEAVYVIRERLNHLHALKLSPIEAVSMKAMLQETMSELIDFGLIWYEKNTYTQLKFDVEQMIKNTSPFIMDVEPSPPVKRESFWKPKQKVKNETA